MGETAENIRERTQIPRERQDAFALASHAKALAARASGALRHEIVPVDVPGRRGETTSVDTDEGPRPDTSLEKLTALRPIFRPGGTVTAGNSSSLNDGAAALLVASLDAAKRLGLTPLARIVSSAVAGVDPRLMGLGPVPATRKALARAGPHHRRPRPGRAERGLRRPSACRHRRAGPGRGAGQRERRRHRPRPPARLLRRPHRHHPHPRDAPLEARYGLATMCIGVGQGVAVIYERAG